MNLTRILVTAAATGALVAAPAAAWAGSNTQTDPTGDSVSTSSFQSSAYVAAPSQVNGNIISTRVAHVGKSVQVKVRFADLIPSGVGAAHYFFFRTDKSLRSVDLVAGAGMWRGKAQMYDRREKKVACRGISHKIDYTANTVLLVIPRACFGNPRWVREANYSVVAETGTSYFWDDARSGVYDDKLYFSPRVRR